MNGRELIIYILSHYMENATIVLRKMPGQEITGSPWVHLESITDGNNIMIVEHPNISR